MNEHCDTDVVNWFFKNEETNASLRCSRELAYIHYIVTLKQV